MSAVDFARLSGVNRSTIHRIAKGQTDPSLQTLRELAIVHGLDLDLRLRPLSDPAAATAARILLDQAMTGWPATPDETRWANRLEPLEDPISITTTAGRASAPAEREGAVLLRGDQSALRLASAGVAGGGPWAISGRAALAYAEGTDIASGPSVLWVTDPVKTSRMLLDTHRPVTSPANAQVVVAPASSSVFVDFWEAGPIRFVAPMQMLLDCIGLGNELEQAALQIAEGWSTR